MLQSIIRWLGVLFLFYLPFAPLTIFVLLMIPVNSIDAPMDCGTGPAAVGMVCGLPAIFLGTAFLSWSWRRALTSFVRSHLASAALATLAGALSVLVPILCMSERHRASWALRGYYGEDHSRFDRRFGISTRALAVRLHHRHITIELFDRLLPHLADAHSVEVYGGTADPGAQVRLADFEDLRCLMLQGTYFHDDDLRTLVEKCMAALHAKQPTAPLGIARLVELDIVGAASVSNRGLMSFARLPFLRWVKLDQFPLDSDGWAALGAMPALRHLWVDGQVVSSRPFQRKNAWTQLRRLDSAGGTLSNEDLRDLATLPQLERLNLYQTALDNTGLMLLSDSPTLKWIGASGTRVSAVGAQEFNRVRPNVFLETSHGSFGSPPSGPN